MQLDLHGKTLYQARVAMDAALRRATTADYRLTVVHGYRGGTALKEMLREEYARHPKVLRLESTLNPGQTVFVLREY